MNRQDFLRKLKDLFPDLTISLIAAYKAVLPEDSVDYNKLYKTFLQNYKYRNAPMAGVLADYLKDATLYRTQENAIERDLKSGLAKVVKQGKTTTLVERDGYVYEFYSLLNPNSAEPTSPA